VGAFREQPAADKQNVTTEAIDLDG
jgi:hypothetical protein